MSETDLSNVSVHSQDKEALDRAAETMFGTADVPYRVTVRRLLIDHDDVTVGDADE